MKVKLSDVTIADAGPKYRGKLYIGRVKMKAWEDSQDPDIDPPVIDITVSAPFKMGLRASVPGHDGNVVDGPLLTDEVCYKKFTDLLKPQINAVVSEYKSGLTKPQREQKILEDTKLYAALTALEDRVNG